MQYPIQYLAKPTKKVNKYHPIFSNIYRFSHLFTPFYTQPVAVLLLKDTIKPTIPVNLPFSSHFIAVPGWLNVDKNSLPYINSRKNNSVRRLNLS